MILRFQVSLETDDLDDTDVESLAQFIEELIDSNLDEQPVDVHDLRVSEL